MQNVNEAGECGKIQSEVLCEHSDRESALPLSGDGNSLYYFRFWFRLYSQNLTGPVKMKLLFSWFIRFWSLLVLCKIYGKILPYFFEDQMTDFDMHLFE